MEGTGTKMAKMTHVSPSIEISRRCSGNLTVGPREENKWLFYQYYALRHRRKMNWNKGVKIAHFGSFWKSRAFWAFLD